MKNDKRTVRVQVGDARVTIRMAGAFSPDVEALPPGWFLFSNLEARILKLLSSGIALSRQEMARKLTDESAEGRLKTCLAALVARRCLLVTAEGYRANIKAEDRAPLVELLDRLLAPAEDTATASPPPGQTARSRTLPPLPPLDISHDEDEAAEADEFGPRIAAAKAARQAQMDRHSNGNGRDER